MTSLPGSRRWWGVWLMLLGLSAILAGYIDMGAPTSWPRIAQMAVGIFVAPGAVIWVALFWHPFAGGDLSGAIRVFIALVNSTLWLIAIYTASRIRAWLKRGRLRNGSFKGDGSG